MRLLPLLASFLLLVMGALAFPGQSSAASYKWGGFSTYGYGTCTSNSTCPTGSCSAGTADVGCGTCASKNAQGVGSYSYRAVCSCVPDCPDANKYCAGYSYDGGCGSTGQQCQGTNNQVNGATCIGNSGGGGGGGGADGTGQTCSCGAMHGATVDSGANLNYGANLCSAGNATYAVWDASKQKFTWKCWQNANQRPVCSVDCFAYKTSVGGGGGAASCGSENGRTIPSAGPDSSKLCVKNGTAYAASNFAARCSSTQWTGWTWKCDTVSCSATRDRNTGAADADQRHCGGGATPSPAAGACGTANGRDYTSQPPASTLCSSGAVSGPTYSATCTSPGGPGGRCANWRWSCGSASCSAWDVSNMGGGGGGSTWTMTVNKTGAGFGKVVDTNGSGIDCGSHCTHEYPTTTPLVYLMATPDSGFKFVKWTGNSCGQQSPATDTLCKAQSANGTDITAEFAPIGGANTCAGLGGTCKASCSSGETSQAQTDCSSGKVCCVPSSGETIKIPGSCGNAAKNYSNTDTQFSGSFCYTGVPEPINASFPAANGSSQWVCKGMTGGADSPACVATRGNAIPSTCSVYTATSAIPEGYGSPFNQISALKEPLLSVTCATNGSTATAGSQSTYVYKTGFVTENGQWKKVDFSGTPSTANEGWFQGTALSNLPAAPSSGQNYVLAFVCQFDGGKWKCGCRDSACTQNYWTIQAYKK